MRGMHRVLFRRRRVFLRGIALILGVCGLTAGPGAQAPAAPSPVDARSREALFALDRYLETWNSRIPALWAASLRDDIRAKNPRIHCITNTVAQAYTANMLLAAGANPNLADQDGVTPLRHARQKGYRVIADMLLSAGARE